MFARAVPAWTFAVIFAASTILANAPAKAQYDDPYVPPWQRPPRAAGTYAGGQNGYNRTGAQWGTYSRPSAWSQPPSGQDWRPFRPEDSRVRATAFEPVTEDKPPDALPQPTGPIPPGGAKSEDGDAFAGGAPGMRYQGDYGGDGPCVNEGGCWECPRGPVWCPPSSPFADRLWIQGEYLLWWTQGAHVPALVTTSPAGTPRNLAGRLDQPDTTILFGNTTLNGNARSGARVTVGDWIDPCHLWGIEGSYWTLGRKTTQFHGDSHTFPILARPFSNVQSQTEVQDAGLVSFPNVVTGSVDASVATELQTAEFLFRRVLADQCRYRIDFLIGYRYSQLDDGLEIGEATTSLDPQGVVPVGTNIDLFDRFDTRNQFHGAELGIAFHEQCCRWSLDWLMKFGLGNTHSVVRIDGSTTVTVPGTPAVTHAGGLLAQPTNIGRFQEDTFSVIPELGLTLGYDLTCHLRATFGYTFIYWSKVARAGDQVDVEVNQSADGTLVGGPHPQFAFRTTDFWAQGLNFGLQYRF